jgi:S-methylmethionine-dependent homocysteine/selenocysteine methylase
VTQKSAAYLRLEERWQDGEVVVLDGGVGSELEQLGFPSERNIGELWGIRALYEMPQLTKKVHRRYAEAGADVITTNTWRIDRVAAAESEGLVPASLGGWREQARLAVALAREASREAGAERAVAFGFWPEQMEEGFAAELADALLEAQPDLILAETIETIPADLHFPEYEILQGTGLPLWVSFRWCRDGPCDVSGIGIEPARGRLQAVGGDLLGLAASELESLGVSAVLINCLPRERVQGTLPLLRRYTGLPLGVYPNVGRYLDPGWKFDETTTPEAYAAEALTWRDEEGASIIGGCCGVGPAHIAAVVRELSSNRPGETRPS